jgi:nicotinamide phosphoribosyltransferase
MKFNPETALDCYKIDHRRQYAPGVGLVFSNLTPRKTYRKTKPNGIVWFGLQYFIKEYLINKWNTEFFQKPKEEVLKRFSRRINNYLGPNQVGIEHIAALHDLGHLPLTILALPEGVQVPYKVPVFVFWNTKPEFYWLTNYLETIASVTIWPLATTATTAKQFKDILMRFANETAESTEMVKFSGHNFSYRGCFGHEAACLADAGWLTSFVGSDTVPGVDFMEEYYNADSDKELVGCSVSATEHSVMASYGKEDELEAFRRIIEDLYPKGIVSIVSDTFDYWKVITEFTVKLKDKILQRDGKTVFRPDSGDNVKIITGYFPDEVIIDDNGKKYISKSDNVSEMGRELSEEEYKGTIECLWDIFGGTTNAKGFKELNSKVSAILGDGVTLEVMTSICERLQKKGFASTNLVYGVGSYSIQYGVSRDSDGYAVKSTYCEVNGVPREIFKDPKTDTSKMKKSAKGLTAVFKDANGEFYLKDQATWDEVLNCEFVKVFENGKLMKDYTLSEVRTNLAKYL